MFATVFGLIHYLLLAFPPSISNSTIINYLSRYLIFAIVFALILFVFAIFYLFHHPLSLPQLADSAARFNFCPLLKKI